MHYRFPHPVSSKNGGRRRMVFNYARERESTMPGVAAQDINICVYGTSRREHHHVEQLTFRADGTTYAWERGETLIVFDLTLEIRSRYCCDGD